MKPAEHRAIVSAKNLRDSAPLGIARRAVRGLSASRRASRRRLADRATVRAKIMQAMIRPTCPARGQPPAARNAERIAHGIAKTVWEILMSAAKVRSLETGARWVK